MQNNFLDLNKITKALIVIASLVGIILILVVSEVIVPRNKLQDVKGVQTASIDENQSLLDSTKIDGATDFATDYIVVANYSSKETLPELANLGEEASIETAKSETKAQEIAKSEEIKSETKNEAKSEVVEKDDTNQNPTPNVATKSTTSAKSVAKSIKLSGDCNANNSPKPSTCSLFDQNNEFRLSVLTVGKVSLESKTNEYQIIENFYSSGGKKTRIIYKYYFATNKIFKIFHESNIPEYCKQYCTLTK